MSLDAAGSRVDLRLAFYSLGAGRLRDVAEVPVEEVLRNNTYPLPIRQGLKTAGRDDGDDEAEAEEEGDGSQRRNEVHARRRRVSGALLRVAVRAAGRTRDRLAEWPEEAPFEIHLACIGRPAGRGPLLAGGFGRGSAGGGRPGRPGAGGAGAAAAEPRGGAASAGGRARGRGRVRPWGERRRRAGALRGGGPGADVRPSLPDGAQPRRLSARHSRRSPADGRPAADSEARAAGRAGEALGVRRGALPLRAAPGGEPERDPLVADGGRRRQAGLALAARGAAAGEPADREGAASVGVARGRTPAGGAHGGRARGDGRSPRAAPLVRAGAAAGDRGGAFRSPACAVRPAAGPAGGGPRRGARRAGPGPADARGAGGARGARPLLRLHRPAAGGRGGAPVAGAVRHPAREPGGVPVAALSRAPAAARADAGPAGRVAGSERGAAGQRGARDAGAHRSASESPPARTSVREARRSRWPGPARTTSRGFCATRPCACWRTRGSA